MWLGGWGQDRLKLTLDHTKIDSDQIDFPVMLHISASSGIGDVDVSDVFDKLTSDANRKKIAVTTSGGVTQCYVEIERWDHANEQAWLWIKAPALSSAADSVFYQYYDSLQADNTTYVGDTCDTPAQSVWDINFKFVMHMADDTTSTIKDSTNNANNGTKVAANRPIETDGKIGKAQDFERSTSDYIDLPSYTLGTLFTLEFIIKPESVVNYEVVSGGVVNRHFEGCCILGDGSFSSTVGNGSSWGNTASSAVGEIVAGTTYHICIIYDGINLINYRNLVQSASVANTVSVPSVNLRLGERGGYYYDGLIDEVRISNIKRTVAWINATYYSNWDELISFEVEELETTFYDLKTEIAAAPTTAFLDLLSDIQASALIFQDLKTDIEATFHTGFVDLKTEIQSKAQKLLDLLSEVKAGNQIITDLKLDVTAKKQVITDLKTFIKAITWNFKNLNTSIEAVRSKWWLNTEITAGCAARWNFNTEWDPNRFLNTEIEAKKPYEFSFKTPSAEGYAATEPSVEFKILGYEFPIQTLFLDYIAVGGTNEYPFQIWWARGMTGRGTLKNTKIKAEYVDTSNSGGFEVVTLDWISIKVGDGEYKTVNETALLLEDIPCDSKLSITLKVECRDCSLTRGLAFFKLIITGDYAESVYRGKIVYQDGACYHSGLYDDYKSIDFISRLYVVE